MNEFIYLFILPCPPEIMRLRLSSFFFFSLSYSSEPSASPAKDNYRMNRYKNKALNLEEMRRRREEEGIQLRKQKREQQVKFFLSPVSQVLE